jgi:anti-sigma regulatory factor (Ser/Thr protein kinase)
MLAMVLCDWEDVRRARECAIALASAAGVPDPEMVATAVGEIGMNCVEHREGAGQAILRIGCRKGVLVLQAENPCERRPSWETEKPELLDGFRAGGYGMLMVRSLAQDVRTTWHKGRVRVKARFAA